MIRCGHCNATVVPCHIYILLFLIGTPQEIRSVVYMSFNVFNILSDNVLYVTPVNISLCCFLFILREQTDSH